VENLLALRLIYQGHELRTWFGHDPEKFVEFRRSDETELASGEGRRALAALQDLSRQGPLTLVFAAHDVLHNNAVVQRDLLSRDDLSHQNE
jgi:uncharacterized protein YeaO (DUF488 family)